MRPGEARTRTGVIKTKAGLSGMKGNDDKCALLILLPSSFPLCHSFPLLPLILTSLTSASFLSRGHAFSADPLSDPWPSHPCVPPLIRPCLSSSHPPPSLRFCRCQSWGLGWLSLTTRKGTKGQIFKLKRKERLRRPLSRGSSQQLAAGDEMRVDLQRSCLVIVMAAPPVGSGSHRDFLDPVDEEYQKNRNDPLSPFNIFVWSE